MLRIIIPKRKVFISYYGGDKASVDAFIHQWANRKDVFIPKVVGTYGQDVIDSDNTEYIMGRLRRDYLGDSTVTILLLGPSTHGRRYVDWELKASLRQGDVYTPNGLIGILLPFHQSAHLPQRFEHNWNREGTNSYARYYYPPQSAIELRNWIEDAYQARATRANWIKNFADRMKYNAKCKVCAVTH